MTTIFSITFARTPAENEGKLHEAHQRLLAKLRAWDRPRWPIHEKRTISVSRACLKYLLDDVVDSVLVMQAIADLYELGIVDRAIPDVDFFRASIRDISIELECEREAAKSGLDAAEIRRALEARRAARSEAV